MTKTKETPESHISKLLVRVFLPFCLKALNTLKTHCDPKKYVAVIVRLSKIDCHCQSNLAWIIKRQPNPL